MKTLTMNGGQWELLIRIDENTKSMKSEFTKHLSDDTSEQALTRQSLSKVHDRVDLVVKDIGLVERGQEKMRSLVIGGLAVATIIISAVQVFVSYFKGG